MLVARYHTGMSRTYARERRPFAGSAFPPDVVPVEEAPAEAPVEEAPAPEPEPAQEPEPAPEPAPEAEPAE